MNTITSDTVITEPVADGTTLTIHGGNLKILADVGDNVKIDASHKVQIRGHIGANCTVDAEDYIEVHDVGDRSRLTSNVGKIRCHRLGNNVILCAKKTVIVGYVPASGHITSLRGEIHVGKDGGATLTCHGNVKVDPVILSKMMNDRNRTKY